MNRIKVLNRYYTNLDYDESDRKKALQEIYYLAQSTKFDVSDDIQERLQVLVVKIHKNFSLFASVCRHIDVIHTILEYLTNYVAKLSNGIKGYSWSEEGEMIILEDSDLFAVIRCLITADYDLYKIWVQKRVKEKFLWLIKRYYSDFRTIIDTFQSLKDIQLHEYPKPTTKIVSIWSEDIVAAKNFALSLNSHIVFINTYMDFCGGIVLLPLSEINHYLHETYLSDIRENKIYEVPLSMNVIYLSHTAEKNANSLICNLFYDGAWQRPKKRMYWKYNGSLWANATNYDIVKCYDSAEKGFKTWSIKPIKTRMQILSKFVSILKDNSKFGLAAIIERWLKCPYLYENTQGFHNTKIEITHTRKPLGVIILGEKNENVFFLRLIQILIAGNSVIVMFDPNFYYLGSYFDTFLICGIPPGVINLLSHEDTRYLEYRLCNDWYTFYIDEYFLKCHSLKNVKGYILQYRKLTVPKQIILHT